MEEVRGLAVLAQRLKGGRSWLAVVVDCVIDWVVVFFS